MCGCCDDGNVFLIGENQALGFVPSCALCGKEHPCCRAVPLNLMCCQCVSVSGGICPHKAGRGAEELAAASGQEEKRENEEQMEELNCE